jgi:hypothetical protein
MSAKWSVFALYDDAVARERAVQFCDSLVQRFWPEFSFVLAWCQWLDLDQPLKAREAQGKVIEANLIVVAIGEKNRLPSGVERWMELALVGRGEREGALVGLPIPTAGSSSDIFAAHVFLRKLAHESGMDYLTAVPQSLQGVPESFEAYDLRATQVTEVLDTILHQSPVPPREL